MSTTRNRIAAFDGIHGASRLHRRRWVVVHTHRPYAAWSSVYDQLDPYPRQIHVARLKVANVYQSHGNIGGFAVDWETA